MVTDGGANRESKAAGGSDAAAPGKGPEPSGATEQPGAGVPVAAPPVGASITAPAEYPPAGAAGRGMFGVGGSGDTSGFGGLRTRRPEMASTPRPFGGVVSPEGSGLSGGDAGGGAPRGEFDEVYDALEEAFPGLDDAIERVIVDRGELTLHVRPERIAEICQVLRDDESLRFELCSSVSGADYLGAEGVDGRRLHVVYHLTSMTYRRRIRLEAAVSVEQPHLPSVTSIYPTADWQEREAYDMFGVIFDGHPNLTRILMPDDWEGHPQRKDYPLGGIPVEYKGAEIPPPDTRRVYQ